VASGADHRFPEEASVRPRMIRARDGALSPEQLLPLVYNELRAIAAEFMSRERPNHTLQPTALVHEVYLRLVDQNQVDFKDRAHFLAIAARTIRRVLIDHSRSNRADKRGGKMERVTLSDTPGLQKGRDLDLLALDEAMKRLAWVHPRPAQIVELRYFGGLTNEEAASVLNVSRTTVANEWALAKAWLSRELSVEHAP
jgi:RNA polymerase sigma-70 factor, ECF subfamily